MPSPARSRRAPHRRSALEELVVAALDEMKAVNVKVIDVRGVTDFADAMVVASGNSDRHVRAIAQHVVDKAREQRRRPMGVEGSRDGEWVLVDLQDVIVHVMLPRVREFYGIEQLWEAGNAALRPTASGSAAPGNTAPGSAASGGAAARPTRARSVRPRRARSTSR